MCCRHAMQAISLAFSSNRCALYYASVLILLVFKYLALGTGQEDSICKTWIRLITRPTWNDPWLLDIVFSLFDNSVVIEWFSTLTQFILIIYSKYTICHNIIINLQEFHVVACKPNWLEKIAVVVKPSHLHIRICNDFFHDSVIN